MKWSAEDFKKADDIKCLFAYTHGGYPDQVFMLDAFHGGVKFLSITSNYGKTIIIEHDSEGKAIYPEDVDYDLFIETL